MKPQIVHDLIRFANNSTSNSLDPVVRGFFYSERERLTNLLKSESDRQQRTGLLAWAFDGTEG